MKKINLFLIILIALSSCSSVQFAKRKHRKGFYPNLTFSSPQQSNKVYNSKDAPQKLSNTVVAEKKRSPAVHPSTSKKNKLNLCQNVKEESKLALQSPIPSIKAQRLKRTNVSSTLPSKAEDKVQLATKKIAKKTSKRKMRFLLFLKVLAITVIAVALILLLIHTFGGGFGASLTGSPSGMGVNFGGGPSLGDILMEAFLDLLGIGILVGLGWLVIKGF
jgi:small-conductance mechanosensitive channel